jgi:hypothetical protein
MKKLSTMKRDPEVEAFLDYLDAMPDGAIDWENAPKTTAADWRNAEILLPVDRDIFEAAAKKQLRRVKASGALMGQGRQTVGSAPRPSRGGTPASPAGRKRGK